MTQSWLAGVALSGTSVAIVYAEMMLHGLNGTDFGKILLGACFAHGQAQNGRFLTPH